MPEVTLEDCMVIADPTFMNSISSFRTNDDCVYCEREWHVCVSACSLDRWLTVCRCGVLDVDGCWILDVGCVGPG